MRSSPRSVCNLQSWTKVLGWLAIVPLHPLNVGLLRSNCHIPDTYSRVIKVMPSQSPTLNRGRAGELDLIADIDFWLFHWRNVCQVIITEDRPNYFWPGMQLYRVISRKERCAKVCGLFFLDCDFRMLIDWAGKSRSHGWNWQQKIDLNFAG